MQTHPLLVIGLDGFELSLAESMAAEGLLPHIKRVKERSGRFLLDHGLPKYSGLAWEHFSSGRSPDDGGRWSAITFDPDTYHLHQDATRHPPFLADLSARTVIFDVPYCDLTRAPNVRGITNWGAHDPGVDKRSRPDALHNEMEARFGPYPAQDYIYGVLWPSADKTRLAAEALVRAIEVRAEASRWVLAERLPDWDLGIVVVSECHSSIEPMWHGIDPQHRLRELPSAAVAREGLRRIYIAIDNLVGRLVETFPNASVMLFAMHGMGTNQADVAAMALLPELLHRHAFGKPHMQEVAWPAFTAGGTPLLTHIYWAHELTKAIPVLEPGSLMDSEPARKGLAGFVDFLRGRSGPKRIIVQQSNIDWIAGSHYRRFWPRMPAFAIPAYYDGRVRINVADREACGMVPARRYKAVRQEIMRLLRDCRSVPDGEPVVENFYFHDKDPHAIKPDESDLYILWRSAPVGLMHPKLGQIGPLPLFRTGGHTGKSGFLYLRGTDIAPGENGVTSSFDVVPTIVHLLGESPLPQISGKSLLPRFLSPRHDHTARLAQRG